MASPDPSGDPSSADSCGSAAPESNLNPAAPWFLPNINPRVQVRLTLNPSFYYCLSPPSPSPLPQPCYIPAVVSSPSLTHPSPIFLYYPINTHQDYNFNPSRPVEPPPRSQHGRLPPPATTDPNPNNPHSDQTLPVSDETRTEKGRGQRKFNGTSRVPNYGRKRMFFVGKNGRRGDSGGRGHGVGGGGNVYTDQFGNARGVFRKRHAVVPVQSDRQITTVMLRNVPNKYTREMLIEFMDKHCQGENEKAEKEKVENDDSEENEFVCSAYDFLYLPMDFESGMNKGYAFVNFTEARAVVRFHSAYNNRQWDVFCSKKRLEVASARIQGKDRLVRHFERMAYPVAEYSAVCFSPARCGSTAVQTIMVGKCTESTPYS